MQYSVDMLEGLKRKIKVVIPKQDIDEKVNTKVREFVRTARIDGFRPGKAPSALIQKRYGASIRNEVLSEAMQHSLREAVEKEDLSLAGTPVVDSMQDDVAGDFSFEAGCEVLPEIILSDLSTCEVEKIEGDVTEDDIDAMLGKLRKQKCQWKPVEREAILTDKVEVDFIGTLDDVPFQGGEGKSVPFELGEGKMLPDFEKQVLGMKAGESKTFPMTFPEEYHSKELAGKEVSFALTLNKVFAVELPEIDEAFINSFGPENESIDLATFKENVVNNMRKEMDARLDDKFKNNVFDALLEQHEFSVPAVMVEDEARLMVQQLSQGRDSDTTQIEAMANMFNKAAERQVRLKLLASHYIEKNGIQVDSDRVQQRVSEIASTYENPAEVESWVYNNKQSLSNIESAVLEEQMVDELQSQMVIKSVKLSYNEIMKN